MKCYIKFPYKTDKDNRAIYMFIKIRSGIPLHWENDLLVFDCGKTDESFIQDGLDHLKNQFGIESEVKYEYNE